MPDTPPSTTLAATLRRETPWFILYLSLFLLIYGYAILRLGMHVDDVYDFGGEETGLYAAAGRWGVVLWRSIFEPGACVWAAGIVSALLISLSIILQTHLLRLTGSLPRLVYGGFYLGCIQFSHMLQFSFLCDAVAASFIAVTGSVWMLQKAGLKSWLLSVLLLVPAFGIYQATAFYFAALFVLCELRRMQLQEAEGMRCRVGKFILTGLSAAIIWYIIKIAAVHLPLVTEAQLTYAEGYQSSLTCWPEFLQATPQGKAEIILNVFMIGYPGQWVSLSAIIALIILYKRYKQDSGKRRAMGSLLLMAALCIIPYALGILLLRQQTPWTFIAEPLMLAGFWGLVAAAPERLTPKALHILLIFLAFILVKALYGVSAQAKEEALRHDICVAELRTMHNAALATARQNGAEASEIILIGEPMNRQQVPDSAAESTLTWSNMLYYYLRHLKLANRMRIGTNSFYTEHKAEFDAMPIWPAPGSVVNTGNQVIIKIGPQ